MFDRLVRPTGLKDFRASRRGIGFRRIQSAASGLRRDAALRHLPVVLVTSLGDQAHRERGVAVGADAYIVKSSFDQDQLLTTIGRLL